MIDLYEQGFTLPLRYDLTPKYGDDNLKTIENRLQCICIALKVLGSFIRCGRFWVLIGNVELEGNLCRRYGRRMENSQDG